jgi:hypothetical protein
VPPRSWINPPRCYLNRKLALHLLLAKLPPRGGVAEWLKAHAWKACLRVTVTRVRIPLPPPVPKSLIYNNKIGFWQSESVRDSGPLADNPASRRSRRDGFEPTLGGLQRFRLSSGCWVVRVSLWMGCRFWVGGPDGDTMFCADFGRLPTCSVHLTSRFVVR